MNRMTEMAMVVFSMGVLVFATGKVIVQQREIAALPPAVLSAIDAQFPSCWKSAVEPVAKNKTYLVTVRAHGASYRIQVREDGEIVAVSQVAGVQHDDALADSFAEASFERQETRLFPKPGLASH